MATYTVTTKVATIKELSENIQGNLIKHDIETLGDVGNVNFLEITQGLPVEEINLFYEIVYKSNVSFKFSPEDKIESVPDLSARGLAKLKSEGFENLSDFDKVYYPEIYDLIGFGPAKKLLVIILSAKLSVKYDKPQWTDDDWRKFTYSLVELGLVTWEDIAICICSELNPPQVGTAVAEQVKDKYPPRQAMKHVFKWFYAQSGKCELSGKRLWLEADHIESKEEFLRSGRDVKEANTLDNFQLLTKRENVIKRGSHKLGGLSFAQASAVLVYILLRFKPKTFTGYSELCRNHGLTMASIRFQEAWGLAEWLAKEGLYEIESE
ncbi:hypothetical protein L4D00_23805 [Photobacterium swingsii]|uniref:hypothetical protein n=1 Tax=Photobacterium swingsii TaxID=680026 RepID=UPI003D1369F7